MKSHEPFQSYLLTGQSMKVLSVEMACLLGVQNKIQAVWSVLMHIEAVIFLLNQDINKLNKNVCSLKSNTMLISEFMCQTTSDCNNKGTCSKGKCQCTSGWDSKADCASEYKNIKPQGLC